MAHGDVLLHSVRHQINRCPHNDRILGQLAFANEMSKAVSGAYDDLVHQAANLLLDELKVKGCVDQATAQAAEEILLPLSEKAKSYKMHCVAHAHIDMNWMWRFDETVSVALDTFRTMLDLLEEYPQYKFSQSQASVYRIVEEYGPADMLEAIKRYVHEGRWEVTASTWVEADKNTPNAESMARHLLYTKQYLSDLLEIDKDSIQLDLEPDTFGHSKNVPEILNQGGVKYYYHMRGSMDPVLCWWVSPSGAKVLSYREPTTYNGVVECEFANYFPGVCKQLGVDSLMNFYGVGDHGGGPTRRDLNRLLDMQTWPVYPTVIFSTCHEYFRDIEARFGDILPVRDTEMNSVFTGCYTSQSRIKMANRVGEATLNEAELFSAIAANQSGYPYATKKFTDAWQRILFNQFHDILTGSGIRDTREYAMGEFQRAMAVANTERIGAIRSLASLIDTSSIPYDEESGENSTASGAGVGHGVNDFHVTQVGRARGNTRLFHLFNSAPFERTQLAELTVWDWPQNDVALLEVCDADGNRLPFQICNHGHNPYWRHDFAVLLVEATVPACGYTTLVIRRSENAFIANHFKEFNCFRADGDVEWERVSTPYEYSMENRYLKAKFNLQNGDLVSLIDKETGKEMLSAPAHFRLILEDPDRGMTSWRVGRYMTFGYLNDVQLKLEGCLGDPLRQRLTVRGGFGTGSRLTVYISLDENAKHLRYDVDCDWHERPQLGIKIPQLNFIAPLSYDVSAYKYDVPAGIITREPIDMDQPGNSFIAAVPAQGGTSMMLSSNFKYGFRGFENAVSLDLIRQSCQPDPYPEYGQHRFSLSLGLVDTDNEPALIRQSYNLWNPFLSFTDLPHEGTLPLSGSFAELKTDSVILQSLKLAEDGSGDFIARLYPVRDEVEATLSLATAPKAAVVTDIHEQATLSSAQIDGKNVTVKLPKEGFVTLRISF